MRDDERILLHEIEKLEAENERLRQQVDALSRALAADTPEYAGLRDAVKKLERLYSGNINRLEHELCISDIANSAIKFINATEAAKAASAGTVDGEAG